MILANAHRTLIIKIITILFILLFVYAATSKLLDYETFTVQLAQSPLLSAYAGMLAWMVPGVEILISIILMLPKYRIIALYASFLLMVMFTVYIVIILNFSDFVPCSCGGVLEKLSWGQHFIFNLVIIVIAALAILFSQPCKYKRKLLLLSILIIVGIGFVTLLFSFSEKKMHRNNAFVRRYLPHPISVQEVYDLKYNSWYFAGINSGKVYLGNATAPLQMLVLDTLLKQTDTIRIQLDNTDLPYKSVTVSVGPTDFFVSDGTVPVALYGSKVNWVAKTFSRDRFFTAATQLDSSRLGIRIANAGTLKNSIRVIQSDTLQENELSSYELPALGDGIFESDGQLLWNEQLQKMVYIYFYSNQYFVIPPSIERVRQQHTLDTVTSPSLEVLHFNKLGQDKLKGNAPTINSYGATYGDYLFIKSKRMGRYESKDMLDEASIIDVYNISKDEYLSSFYLYHQDGKKLTAFRVVKNTLYAIMEDKLVKFKLESSYFKDFNSI